MGNLNRRDFLKNTSLAAAGMAVNSKAFPKSQHEQQNESEMQRLLRLLDECENLQGDQALKERMDQMHFPEAIRTKHLASGEKLAETFWEDDILRDMLESSAGGMKVDPEAFYEALTLFVARTAKKEYGIDAKVEFTDKIAGSMKAYFSYNKKDFSNKIFKFNTGYITSNNFKHFCESLSVIFHELEHPRLMQYRQGFEQYSSEDKARVESFIRTDYDRHKAKGTAAEKCAEAEHYIAGKICDVQFKVNSRLEWQTRPVEFDCELVSAKALETLLNKLALSASKIERLSKKYGVEPCFEDNLKAIRETMEKGEGMNRKPWLHRMWQKPGAEGKNNRVP